MNEPASEAYVERMNALTSAAVAYIYGLGFMGGAFWLIYSDVQSWVTTVGNAVVVSTSDGNGLLLAFPLLLVGMLLNSIGFACIRMAPEAWEV